VRGGRMLAVVAALLRRHRARAVRLGVSQRGDARRTFEIGMPSPAMVRVAWEVMGFGRGMVSLRPSNVSTLASPPHSAVTSGTLTAGCWAGRGGRQWGQGWAAAV
jgi:hypothetical protein